MKMDLKVTTSLPVFFEKVQDLPDSRFTEVRVFICHTKDNLNGSYFDKKVIEEEMMPSLSNIPILGYIKVDNTNESDFSGHEERIIIEKDNVSIEYLGRAYGLISESNDAHFEMKMCDDGVEREFLVCNGLIWRRFSEAVDIFDRDEVKGQSMELQPDSIKGKFEKDGLFHFTNAKFEGLCILGDDVTPAMTGSVIEKFSMSNVKTQLQEMIQELNITFSLPQNAVGENQIDIKGGRNMPKNIKNTSSNFSLSQEQLEGELKRELAEIESIQDPYWSDWSYPRFSFVDYVTEQLTVVASDAKNGYALVGFTYSVNADAIEIDPQSAQRYKITFEPMDLSVDLDDDSDVDINDFALISSAKLEYQLKVKEKEMEQKFSAVESELNELKVFKSDSIKKEREGKENALYEKLASQLSEEEITQFKEKSTDMTIEELEKEVFAFIGQKVANNTVHNFNKKSSHIIMSIDEGNKDSVNAPYGGVVEKYVQK